MCRLIVALAVFATWSASTLLAGLDAAGVRHRKGRLAPENIDSALRKVAAQANSSLPAKQQTHRSVHGLRHAALRKAAEKQDIRYAMKLSGHTSGKYIWRYTEPSRREQEQALEELF